MTSDQEPLITDLCHIFITGKMSRSRGWCFTLNNYTSDEERKLKELECKYMIFGHEVGEENGTPHLQGYVYFETVKSFEQMKAVNARWSIRSAKGNAQQNYDYCSKQGNDVFEKGEKPQQGKRKAHEEVVESVKRGATMREVMEIPGSNYQSLRTAELLFKYIEKPREKKPTVIWIYGEPGSGKTSYVKQFFSRADTQYVNASQLKWFDGYDGQPACVIDEVDNETPYWMLKAICDEHPYRVEMKGSSRQFVSENIYITSLEHPAKLFYYRPYHGGEMLRRIDKVLLARTFQYIEVDKMEFKDVIEIN